MKKFLAIFILSLCLINSSQADDIRDFQIGGMSLGESLLDYFNEKEISKALDVYKDKKYTQKTLFAKQNSPYEQIQFAYKSSDQKKIIVGLGGVIFFPNNISKCKKEMKKISTEVANLFSNTNKKEWGKSKMTGGQGDYFPIVFNFTDGSAAMVACYKWNKETGIDYNLKVTLFTAEFNKYLKN